MVTSCRLAVPTGETAAVTADYLLKILIEVNSEKVEKALQAATGQIPEEPERDEGHPA